MDLWVVAAATGAGYIAKYWQSLSEAKDGSSESLSGNSIQAQSDPQNLMQNQTHPFHRLAQKSLGGDFSTDTEDVSDGLASTSGGNGKFLANLDNYEDYNVLSLANLSPWFGGTEMFEGNVDEIGGKNDFSGNSGDVLPQFAADRLTNCKSLRSRRSHGFSVKPLGTLESCLNAQLYREHTKREENVISPVPSLSTPALRPLLVTDASRIISRADSDPVGVRFDGGEDKLRREVRVCLEGNNSLLRTTQLLPPLRRSVELPRKPKPKPKPRSGGPLHSQGSANGMLLFFIGITIGIMSASVANRRDVEKLNKLLRQTENLVQDLHEELDMKDMLTVKELTSEAIQAQTIESKETNDLKVNNSDVLSKIEAELEAELEMLEHNMKLSSLERISDFVELDPDFEASVVQGELKLKAINRQIGGSSDSDCDASGASTGQTHNGNYAVSPRKLSLRLHELIESRLEARIKELETALENSKKRFNSLESQSIISRSYSEVEFSSSPGSPTIIDESSERDKPLLVNLSGEALDAYNEAYEEMIRCTETDQNTSNKEVFGDQNNGSEERWSRSLVCDKIRTWEVRSRESNEVRESENDDEDEFEQLLIKQIVEKTKRCSSLDLNAHLMLCMDDSV